MIRSGQSLALVGFTSIWVNIGLLGWVDVRADLSRLTIQLCDSTWFAEAGSTRVSVQIRVTGFDPNRLVLNLGQPDPKLILSLPNYISRSSFILNTFVLTEMDTPLWTNQA